MVRKPGAVPVERGVEDVGGLGPFEARAQALAGDTAGVEQVLDVVVEPLGLVARHMSERSEPRLGQHRGRAAQHRGGPENGCERRAQLVRHRPDQRLAQMLGLGAHARLVGRALGPLGVALDADHEVADHQRHDGEQREVDQLLPFLDLETVDRRIEEERGGDRARAGGEQGGSEAPAHRRDQHRHEIERADVTEVDKVIQRADRRRGRADRNECEDEALEPRRAEREAGWLQDRVLELHGAVILPLARATRQKRNAPHGGASSPGRGPAVHGRRPQVCCR